MSLDERREQQLIALIGRTAELEESVDQDVTSGSSPALDGSNITSVPAADLDNSGVSRMRITKNDAQSIPDSTWTIVEYDDVGFDNLNEYDNTTNYRFTATNAGYYLVTASLLSASVAWAAGEAFQLALFKNGSWLDTGHRGKAGASVTTFMSSTLSTMLYLATNDYIDIRLHQTQGAAINTHTNVSYNYFCVHKLS